MAPPKSSSKIPSAPRRVHVPPDKKPPRGVLWVDGVALDYHAHRAHYSRMLSRDVGAEPARLDEFRELVRRELGTAGGTWWGYYRGRQLACPYRCALDSTTCPVDVIVEEVNRPRRPAPFPATPEAGQ